MSREDHPDHLAALLDTVVSRAVPRGSTVLVAAPAESPPSIDGLQIRPFPEAPGDGVDSAPPTDTAALIAALEASRERGAEFLVLPATSDRAPGEDGLRAYAAERYRLVVHRPEACDIYALFER